MPVQKNLQGDVTRIYDGNGNLAAQYVYDAWGNHKVLNANGTEITDESFIGNVNPIRYRGYYYDEETGLYYLQSRYYDPEVGRFINADDIDYIEPEALMGCNLYAYCGNNPVMYVDPSGCSFIVTLIIGAVIAGAINGVFKAISTIKNGGDFRNALGSFVGGFITGATIGAASILGGGLAVGAFTLSTAGIIGASAFLTVGTFGGGFVANLAESAINGKQLDFTAALNQGALTFFAGITNFGVGYAMGVAGLWNSLKPGNGFMDSIKVSWNTFVIEAGRAGFKSIILGISAYLGANLFAMVMRSIIKYVFSRPWKDAMEIL